MPVGRPKKTWSKVVEEDMKKLNIRKYMAKECLILVQKNKSIYLLAIC